MRISPAILLLLAASLTPLGPTWAQTPDYNAEKAASGRVLDYINAQSAYDNGLTGAGTTIGVIDEPMRLDHPEISDKAVSLPIFDDNGNILTPDWNGNTHGSHVAGLAAANRDGVGMHGVAYNASLAGAPFLLDIKDPDNPQAGFQTTNLPVNVNNFFSSNPGMRVVNNSWGSNYYPIWEENLLYDTSIDDVNDGVNDPDDPLLRDLRSYALANPETLMVFAAGNSGHGSASVESLLPRYTGTELGNWLAVGAADTTSTNNFTINSDGSVTPTIHTATTSAGNKTFSTSIGYFSNLAEGAERWTVYAPGSEVYSLDAANNGYMPDTGTSMAAPVVTGAAALVEQAHPWLTGKQLGDAILSTASFPTNMPDYIVTHDNADGTLKIHLSFIEQTSPAINTVTEAMEYIAPVVVANPELWLIDFDANNVAEVLTIIETNLTNSDGSLKTKHFVASELTAEEVFGQGFLNVGKAVEGIAELDANRMTTANVLTLPELGAGYQSALETYDTKGYSSEFSNDITTQQWNDIYHHDEFKTTGTTGRNNNALALQPLGNNIGIRKTGAGQLILSGNNDYQGATLVEGGELALMTRENVADSGQLTNSDVVVRLGGTFSGDGTVHQTVYNSGVVAPGVFTSASRAAQLTGGASTLNVGTYTQTVGGTLLLNYDQTGNYGQLAIADTNGLAGQLVLAPQADFYANDSELSFNQFIDYTGIGTLNTANLQVVTNTTSPTLTTTLEGSLTAASTVSITRQADAYSQYATNSNGAAVGQTLREISFAPDTNNMSYLLTALDFSNPNGQDVSTALAQMSPEPYGALGAASLQQQHTLNNLLRHKMLTSTKSGDYTATTGSPFGAPSVAADSDSWQTWGTVLGSFSTQSTTGEQIGWDSDAYGLLLGFDRTLNSGLTWGAHAAISARKLEMDAPLSAEAKTQSIQLGLHSQYRPDAWDGFYLNGGLRMGFEQNDLNREVILPGYLNAHESDWVDFVGNATLGAGKDWQFNNITAGPLAWLDYSFVHRPDFTETGGAPSRLGLQSGTNDTFSLALGGHVSGVWPISETGSTLVADLLAAWQHRLSGDDFATTAAFVGYENFHLNSNTPLGSRDSFMLQGSLGVHSAENFFFGAEVGGQLAGSDNHSYSLGLNFSYHF